MSKPKRQTQDRPTAVPEGVAPDAPDAADETERCEERNRIDPPHEMASAPAAAPNEPSEAIASASGSAPQPVDSLGAGEAPEARAEAQAGQLAGYLRRRQKELDHRESQVNARQAGLERDMRAARLWLKEREAELADRAEVLDRCQAGLEEREADSKTREAELERRVRESDATRAARATAQRSSRRQELEMAESRVEQARAEAEDLREQLRQAREELSEEARQQRRRLAEQQRAALAEIDRQREAVRRRGEHADKAHTALEQLRSELGRMHRETLEIRLATEELWAQLSGAAPPAALTKSLSGIRSKLADHYRLANAELRQQKMELEAIRRQLAEQYDKVLRQKQDYDRWARQHQHDTEADASRLAAREDELCQLQAELNDRAVQWQVQRLDYEQQIRRLTDACAARDAVPA